MEISLQLSQFRRLRIDWTQNANAYLHYLERVSEYNRVATKSKYIILLS